MNLPKILIFIGLGAIALGLILWGFNKVGIPFGKLPGDIHVQKEKVSFYFPIVTSIILSIILTIVINLILWISKK